MLTDLRAGLRQVEVDEVAQLLLSEIGYPGGRVIAVEADPLVLFRVATVLRAICHLALLLDQIRL